MVLPISCVLCHPFYCVIIIVIVASVCINLMLSLLCIAEMRLMMRVPYGDDGGGAYVGYVVGDIDEYVVDGAPMVRATLCFSLCR